MTKKPKKQNIPVVSAPTPKIEPTLKRVPITALVPADWNYKVKSTPDQEERLWASIVRDKSAGVLATRVLADGKREVIDGNHRLEVLRKRGVASVIVEDFGKISQAEAVAISVRRNEQWFKNNVPALNVLLRDVVVPEIPVGDLLAFMPDPDKLNDMLNNVLKGDKSSARNVVPFQYRVLVEVAGEIQQGELIKRLEKEGFKCQPLMS